MKFKRHGEASQDEGSQKVNKHIFFCKKKTFSPLKSKRSGNISLFGFRLEFLTTIQYAGSVIHSNQLSIEAMYLELTVASLTSGGFRGGAPGARPPLYGPKFI